MPSNVSYVNSLSTKPSFSFAGSLFSSVTAVIVPVISYENPSPSTNPSSSVEASSSILISSSGLFLVRGLPSNIFFADFDSMIIGLFVIVTVPIADCV